MSSPSPPAGSGSCGSGCGRRRGRRARHSGRVRRGVPGPDRRGGRVLRRTRPSQARRPRNGGSCGRGTPGCSGASSSTTTWSPHWLEGDPSQPAPPAGREDGRNADWPHVYNRDIISMPDKWEYPWFAAWDLAFHMIPFARIDPHFAKEQLLLLLREWYMHPNGQIPAYEFAFGDVNPPVHAWACWRVYKMTGAKGKRDRLFLERAFQKLLLNFTWWVNRKDPEGRNLFAGGFLGLDNIGVFDRSRPLPTGGHLEQADGTAWMAFYCNTMLSHGAGARERGPGVRGPRLQVLRALHRHRAGDQHAGRLGAVARGRRLLLRPAPRGRPARAAAGPLARGR